MNIFRSWLVLSGNSLKITSNVSGSFPVHCYRVFCKSNSLPNKVGSLLASTQTSSWKTELILRLALKPTDASFTVLWKHLISLSKLFFFLLFFSFTFALCSTYNYAGSFMNRVLSAFEKGDLALAQSLQVCLSLLSS